MHASADPPTPRPDDRSGTCGRRVELAGVELDALTRSAVVEQVVNELAVGNGGWLATPNLDQLRLASSDGKLAALLHASDLTVADGMPLIWASRLQAEPLPERVAGSDLVWDLGEAASTHGLRLDLIGGAGSAGERAATVLADRFPGLDVAGHPLPMDFEPGDPTGVERIAAVLKAREPDLVYVGLGFPKQERLIAELGPRLPSAWFIGVGISLSFIAGDVRRAPPWLASLGLEWAHRLAQEPVRLWRRYLVHDVPFLVRLVLRSLSRRADSRRKARQARP